MCVWQAELKALVPKTPNDLYAWVAYGTLKIKKAGYVNHPLTCAPRCRCADRVPIGRRASLSFCLKCRGELADLQSNLLRTRSRQPLAVLTRAVLDASVYNLCTNSDDGSYMYVDKNMEVNNDGLHGPVNKCADVSLSAGNHQIIVAGFQNYGGVYQVDPPTSKAMAQLIVCVRTGPRTRCLGVLLSVHVSGGAVGDCWL